MPFKIKLNRLGQFMGVPGTQSGVGGGSQVATATTPIVAEAVPQCSVHVTRKGKLLPATTTEQLFLVGNGRCLIWLFQGLVTTVLDATDPIAKITVAKLDTQPRKESNAGWLEPAGAAVVGTAVDVASTTAMGSLEVGGMITVLGSGAALIVNNAGAGLSTLGRNAWIVPGPSEIYLTTGATNLTGFVQWDVWYQPLDAGAFIVPNNVATVKI